MTTDSIKSVQILLEANNGEVLIGTSSDPMLLRVIASYVKFVKMDKSKFVALPIKDIMEKGGVDK